MYGYTYNCLGCCEACGGCDIDGDCECHEKIKWYEYIGLAAMTPLFVYIGLEALFTRKKKKKKKKKYRVE
jgi:hypothetical protein